jgi:hypothetical protein
MLSIDGWIAAVSTFQIFTISFMFGIAMLLVQGQIPQHYREKLPWSTSLPTFKLRFASPVCLLMYLGGTFLQMTELLLLISFQFPKLLENNPKACHVGGRFLAFLVISAYFSLIAILIIRAKASQRPNVPVSLFERFVLVFLLISVPFVWFFCIFFSEGQLITQVVDDGSSRTLCILVVTNSPFLVLFSFFDVFISLSLLIIFYSRIRALDNNAIPEELRQDYKQLVDLNMRCSGILVVCTVCVTQIMLTINLQWMSFGLLTNVWNIPMSSLFCVMASTVVAIFERQFVWTAECDLLEFEVTGDACGVNRPLVKI